MEEQRRNPGHIDLISGSTESAGTVRVFIHETARSSATTAGSVVGSDFVNTGHAAVYIVKSSRGTWNEQCLEKQT